MLSAHAHVCMYVGQDVSGEIIPRRNISENKSVVVVYKSVASEINDFNMNINWNLRINKNWISLLIE